MADPGFPFDFASRPDYQGAGERASALRLAALAEQAIADGTATVTRITPDGIQAHHAAAERTLAERQQARQQRGILKAAATNAENNRRRKVARAGGAS